MEKIVCIGRNYVEHIKELNNEMPDKLVVFNKPYSAKTDNFYYFKDTRFETELCFLVGSKKVAIGFDLTNVKEQEYAKKKGLPWERAKAFKYSAVISEFVDFNDFNKLSFKMYKNGILTQEANTTLMLYKLDDILKEISFLNLLDGDIIMSGTPKGVGYYDIKDKFEVKLFEDDKLLLEKTYIVKDING